MSFLLTEHIDKIFNAYDQFKNNDHFSRVVDIETILSKDASLNIPLYISPTKNNETPTPSEAFIEWEDSSKEITRSIKDLFNLLSK